MEFQSGLGKCNAGAAPTSAIGKIATSANAANLPRPALRCAMETRLDRFFSPLIAQSLQIATPVTVKRSIKSVFAAESAFNERSIPV